MDYKPGLEFARSLDQADPLKRFRDRFFIPEHHGEPVVYLTGNSLGLQPKSVQSYLNDEIDSWKSLGVEGHFEGKRPWYHYHKISKEPLARLLGARPEEVVSMNNLTSNLHLMMVSFYRPTSTRYKIMVESGAFPSDQYAVETQARFHGFDPADAIVEVKPGEGHNLSIGDIESAFSDYPEEIALALFPGVQYYTGQRLDIAAITSHAHQAGAMAGFDLAHAVGNVPLEMHESQADFAVWCSYKYLNSGPGNVSGIFVHDRHGENSNLPRFGGWWGHREDIRFNMAKGFEPMPGADGWQLSNVNVLSSAAHLASLEIFDEAGMPNLREKSIMLTDYMDYLLRSLGDELTVITPSTCNDRGCQLSLRVTSRRGKQIHEELMTHGVSVDWREPNVIRAAPVPLYNSYEDVFRFVRILKEVLAKA